MRAYPPPGAQDATRVLLVRNLRKLALEGARLEERLRHSFRRFGEVSHVHIGNLRGGASQQDSRQRPATGIVVMKDGDAAAKALGAGPEHDVDGAQLVVQAFLGQPSEEGSDEDGDGGERRDQGQARLTDRHAGPAKDPTI